MEVEFMRASLISLILFVVFFVAHSEAKGIDSPELIVESGSPVSIFFDENGHRKPVFISKEIEGSIGEVYSNVSLKDIDGDGVVEVVATMESNSVNVCSKVYKYEAKSNSLIELKFSGGNICNAREESGYLVSSYRDGGVWKEDFYRFKNGMVNIYYEDSCVGCGEVVRTEFTSSGKLQYLVTDSEDFKGRLPVVVDVSSNKAVIYSDLEPLKLTRKYLVEGDRASVLEFGSHGGEDYAKIRFKGKSITEGWIKCSDASQCDYESR
ncbi:hypothetical protein [Pseudomonas nicosulfuronedens]